jgi:hypothetical protein
MAPLCMAAIFSILDLTFAHDISGFNNLFQLPTQNSKLNPDINGV